MTLSREELIDHILKIIQDENRDRAIEISMDMKIADVNIDSVDVISILFRLEDEYKVRIDLNFAEPPETVGELVNAIIEFIPHTDAMK